MKFRVYALLLVVAMLFVACGGTESLDIVMKDDTAMMDEEPADEMMEEESHDNERMEEDDMMETEESLDEEMMDDESDDDMMDDDDSDQEMMDEKSDDDTMADDGHGDDAMMNDDDAMMDDDDAMMEDKDDGMMEDESSDNQMIDNDSSDDMMSKADLPDWFSVQLTDVNTSETFNVADFQGKVVLVETLAVWCSNCLRQQNEVQALHELLGERDDLISLGLDIDPNESDDILSGHTAKHGFGWVYAVAPREVAREIGQLYGDQFLNPPSTPMLIIDRHGEVHLLPFGIKSAEDLNAALEPFLSDGM